MVLNSAFLKAKSTASITFKSFTIKGNVSHSLTFYYTIVLDDIKRIDTDKVNIDVLPYLQFSVSAGDDIIHQGYLMPRYGKQMWLPKCVNLQSGTTRPMVFSITGFDIYVAVDDIILGDGECKGQ